MCDSRLIVLPPNGAIRIGAIEVPTEPLPANPPWSTSISRLRAAISELADVRRMLLPAVCPSCWSSTLVAIMFSTVIAPLCWPLTPAPVNTVNVTLPVPALSVVPAAIVMPPSTVGSRSVEFALVSFAVSEILALLVVIFALT